MASTRSKLLYLTQEGQPCRSKYEAMYDVYLHESGILHSHEVPMWDAGKIKFIADFRVGEPIVEIAGMLGFKKYDDRHKRKMAWLRANSVPVIVLTASEVQKLFSGCSLPLITKKRFCSACSKETLDLVKGTCRTCYMKQWHSATEGGQCTCGSSTKKGNKFCSRKCYWISLKSVFPSKATLATRAYRERKRIERADVDGLPT
jgi:hypothetical protein